MLRRPFGIASVAIVTGLAAAAPAFAQAAGGIRDENVGAMLLRLLAAVLALLLALGLAMFAVKTAIGMFDRWTKGMDEWAEIRRGNIAVGILLAAVILAVANVIESGVTGLTRALMVLNVAAIVIGVINLAVALLVATLTVSLALRIFDKMTKDLDEMAEIGRGNISVAVLLGGVLIAVSLIVSAGVEGIANILDVRNLSSAVGVDLD